MLLKFRRRRVTFSAMIAPVRNRLILLGVLWAFVLAVIPALVMVDPYRLSGFLIAALCARP